MRVFSGSNQVDSSIRGGVLTIGNFDGVHLGHGEILRRVVARGIERRRPTLVYTFDPHPRRVLYPDQEQLQLMTAVQLENGLEQARVDALIREAFTPEFASLSAEDFLQQVIRDRVGASEVFVGHDFHFGKGRSGSADTLEQLGPTLGLKVTIVPQVDSGGERISSTRIRRLLSEGNVEVAADCLGRPYAILASVVRGDGRGRELGFPTANLLPENEISPAPGVYATMVRLHDGTAPSEQRLPSVTNIGTRPTFGSGSMTIETHILDFDRDLYAATLSLEFHARIRPEERFSGPEALRQQIAADAIRARDLLTTAQPIHP